MKIQEPSVIPEQFKEDFSLLAEVRFLMRMRPKYMTVRYLQDHTGVSRTTASLITSDLFTDGDKLKDLYAFLKATTVGEPSAIDEMDV